MSIATEIERIQNAKASIKASIENKGVEVGDGTLDTYASKIDEIATGGDISEYFGGTLKAGTAQSLPGWLNILKDVPDVGYEVSGTSGRYMFYNYPGTKLPKIDTSAFTNFESFCDSAKKITEVSGIDTSNATNMKSAFNGCSELLRVIGIDTSKVTGTNLTYCFANSYKIEELPTIDCQNATSLQSTFYGFNGTELNIINTQKITSFYYAFLQNPNLKKLSELDGSACIQPGKIEGGLLEEFNGIKNLGMAYDTTKSANFSNYKFDLSKSLKLTRESVVNIINNLYDIASLGVQTQTIDLHATALAKLTAEEIAVATNKGWTVS